MRFFLTAIFTMSAMLPVAAQQHQPDGSGDPKSTTCMTGEKPTDSQLPLRICYSNAQWAELKARFIVIAPNGQLMLAADAPAGTNIIGPDGKALLSVNDPRNIHGRMCENQYIGGPSASASPNFNVVCDNAH